MEYGQERNSYNNWALNMVSKPIDEEPPGLKLKTNNRWEILKVPKSDEEKFEATKFCEQRRKHIDNTHRMRFIRILTLLLILLVCITLILRT